jgi:uncharacterized membrane protein YbhN (UPF0104 family)
VLAAEEATAALDGRRLLWRLGWLLLAVVLVGLAIARLPGLSALRARFAHADPGWIGLAAALETGSVLAFAVAFHSAFSRRIRWRDSASIAMTAQGVNVLVPAGGSGGLAVAAVIMTRAGMSLAFAANRMIGLFLITAVATNVLVIVVAGLGVWVGVLPGNASWDASLLPALGAALVVATVAYLSRRLGVGPQTVRGRLRSAASRAATYLRDGITRSTQLVRTRDPLLLFGALGYVLLDAAALAAGFRAFGSGGLPVGTMLLAYTLGQAGSIVSLPGTTEGGLVGVFVLYGAPLTLATSAILLYRAVQSLVPLALGLLGVAGLRDVKLSNRGTVRAEN